MERVSEARVRPGSHIASIRRSGRVLLGLVFALCCGQAGAQAVVNDPPHTIKTVLGWIESHRQDLKEIQQWRSQLDHYQQQLVTMSQFADRALTVNDRFELRADDYGMAESCPGTAGVGGLWSALRIDPMGDVRSQQSELCGRMVLATNARYNEQVRMLQRIRDDDLALRRLAAARVAAGDRQGALAANDNDVARLVARASTDLQYTQGVLTAYDGYIADIGMAQSMLTERALSGSPVGGVVQGIALKAALEAARRRER